MRLRTNRNARWFHKARSAVARSGLLPQFLVFYPYLLSIALLRQCGLHDAGFPFWMSLIWAIVPLGLGLLVGSPSAKVTGFILACLGPYQKTTLLIALLTIAIMVGERLVLQKGDIVQAIRRGVQNRAFVFMVLPVIYIAIVWVIRLGDSTDAWSLLALFLTMFVMPFAVYTISWLSWTQEEQIRAIRSFCIVLLALGAVAMTWPAVSGGWEQYTHAVYVYFKMLSVAFGIPQPLDYVDPDTNTASLRSAHYMALLMLTCAVGLFLYSSRARHRGWPLLLALLSLYVSGMGENAHMLAGSGAGVVGIAAAVTLRGRVPAMALAVALIVFVGGLIIVVGKGLYFADDLASKSAKARLFTESWQFIVNNPGRAFIGEGPASFSSLAARKRLPLDLTDEIAFPILPTFVSPRYLAVLKETNKARTLTTTYRPISGVVALVMEWGMLGTGLLVTAGAFILSVLIRIMSRADNKEVVALSLTALFIIVTISASTLFRPYFEYHDVMMVASMTIMLSLLKIKKTSTCETLHQNAI